MFEVTNYGRICQDLSSALKSSKSSANLCELAQIHKLYRTLARQSPRVHANGQKLQAVTLAEILANSRDSLLENQNTQIDNETVFSEPINNDEENRCRQCNKIQLHHGNSVLRLQSVLQSRSQWLDQATDNNQIEDSASDKCIGTDDLNFPDDTCVCDAQSDLVPYLPSGFMMASSREHNEAMIQNYEEHHSSVYNLDERNSSSVDNLTVRFETIEINRTDRVPQNGIPMSEFVTFDKINSRQDYLTNNYPETFSSRYYVPLEQPLVDQREDDDYDCVSNVSEDSELMMNTSKLSKFLCVGVSKSKSKTPYKPAKQQSKSNESKKITSKLKELRMRAQSKSRESLKSPDPLPPGKIKSPVNIIVQDIQDKKSEFEKFSNKPHSIPPSSPLMREIGSQLTSPVPTSHVPTPESYDSGHESGLTHCGTSNDKTNNKWSSPHDHMIRGRGQLPPHLAQQHHLQAGAGSQHSQAGTSGSLGTTTSLGESSGYESIPRDSECSSFSSSQESEVDDEHKKDGVATTSCQGAMPRISQLSQSNMNWQDNKMQRISDIEQLRRSRQQQQQVIGLKQTQSVLKSELAKAKAALNVPDDSWKYERKSNVRVLSLFSAK